MELTDQYQAPEQVGPAFSIDFMRLAQQKSWAVLAQIAAAIKPGMSESTARQLALDLLQQSGVERLWHPVIIRFGPNTCKIYSEVSDKGIILQENDIFFIDLGPVYAGHEGDVGATFVVGEHPQMQACANAAQRLFEIVRRQWLLKSCSGQELYQYAQEQAVVMGYQLNLAIKGHRVSEYPHQLYAGGNLGDFNGVPRAGVWVLEIQIQDPELNIGAFYEDVLLPDESLHS
ncbi:MAG: M24 family metallopeptidase [Rheinheimera sp.]